MNDEWTARPFPDRPSQRTVWSHRSLDPLQPIVNTGRSTNEGDPWLDVFESVSRDSRWPRSW